MSKVHPRHKWTNEQTNRQINKQTYRRQKLNLVHISLKMWHLVMFLIITWTDKNFEYLWVDPEFPPPLKFMALRPSAGLTPLTDKRTNRYVRWSICVSLDGVRRIPNEKWVETQTALVSAKTSASSTTWRLTTRATTAFGATERRTATASPWNLPVILTPFTCHTPPGVHCNRPASEFSHVRKSYI